MRLGLIGPADDDDALREAVSFLLADAEADQVVYLGDGERAAAALAIWAREIEANEAQFFARARDLALRGDPIEIDAFLAEDAPSTRLSSVRCIPPPPARAVEMLDDRLVLFVRDKSVLDEDDIANATLIVYGNSLEASVRRFGRRVFFTPGPLSLERVGLVEYTGEGASVALFDLSGAPLLREPLAAGTTKLTVAS